MTVTGQYHSKCRSGSPFSRKSWIQWRAGFGKGAQRIVQPTLSHRIVQASSVSNAPYIALHCLHQDQEWYGDLTTWPFMTTFRQIGMPECAAIIQASDYTKWHIMILILLMLEFNKTLSMWTSKRLRVWLRNSSAEVNVMVIWLHLHVPSIFHMTPTCFNMQMFEQAEIGLVSEVISQSMAFAWTH